MPTLVRPWTDDDFDRVRAVVTHPSLASRYEHLQGDGLAELNNDLFFRRGTRMLAEQDGVPVGFGFGFVFGDAGGARWSMQWGGVVEGARRRGIGTRLLAAVEARVRAESPGCEEVCIAAWEPCPDAIAFAQHSAYALTRRSWRMTRPVDASLEVTMPDGVELRPFDGSDEQLADWTDAYNDSFAERDHFFVTTVEETRRIAARPTFKPGGLVLAYRDGRCVGFCRNHLYADRGEVEILSVTRAARGIGLGRALLRWGVRWISQHATPRVTLAVDGDNEKALSLYRSEGFEVERTRNVFGKAIRAATAPAAAL